MKTAPLDEILAQAEKSAIARALRRNGNRSAAAAQELGITRVTMWRKLKQHGLRRRVLVDVKGA